MDLKSELMKDIETMCRRCVKREKCGGTGCKEKDHLIQGANYVGVTDKHFREWVKLP